MRALCAVEGASVLMLCALLAGFTGYAWAVSRDGQRFLMNTPVGEPLPSRLLVATHWTSELAKR